MDLSILPDDELRSLHARISALLANKANATDEQLLFSAIATYLDRRGQALHFGALNHSALYPTFRRGTAAVAAYSHRFFQPSGRAERLKAYQILIRVLLRWLEAANVPISLKTVVQNLDKLPRLVDDAFPGYCESGLLPVVLQRQVRI